MKSGRGPKVSCFAGGPVVCVHIHCYHRKSAARATNPKDPIELISDVGAQIVKD